MKFLNVTGEAFLTLLKPFHFNLDTRGLILIQGENKVDSSASSNGAGKSSLVDAISWVIYGYTARGLSGDAVVNSKVKKGCQVSIDIEDDVGVYTIVRKRKPAALQVKVVDKATGTASDLTRGTEKETQELINRIMGCSLEVFLAAIYAGQEQMPDLPGMTDKQLKTLVEQAAGTDKLAAGYTIARQRLSDAKLRLMTAESSKRTVEVDITNARNDLAAAGIALTEWVVKRDASIAAILAEATVSKSSLDAVQALIDAHNEPGMLAEQDEIKAGLDSYVADKAKIDAYEKTITEAERAAGAAALRRDAVKASLEAAEAQLLHFETHDDTCQSCGAPLSAEKKKAAVVTQKAVVEKWVDALKAAEGNVKLQEAGLAEVRAELQALEAKFVKPEELLDRQSTLNKAQVELTRLKGLLTSHKVALSGHAANLKRTREEENPHTAHVEALKHAIDSKLADHVVASSVVEEMTKKVQVLEDAVQVLGPAGARAQILDTVTPQLNASTAEYLGAMSDGAISALWSTLSTTAKGEVREKFNIEVNNVNGGESFLSNSGGEKRKVRLSCYMALQDLVATRAGKPLDLFVGDEIDHALDPAGLERLMVILEKKARERGTVLVVSHNSLSDWIDNVVTVVKTDAKTSHLEGAIA